MCTAPHTRAKGERNTIPELGVGSIVPINAQWAHYGGDDEDGVTNGCGDDDSVIVIIRQLGGGMLSMGLLSRSVRCVGRFVSCVALLRWVKLCWEDLGDHSAVPSTAGMGAQVWLTIVRSRYGATTKSNGARTVQ